MKISLTGTEPAIQLQLAQRVLKLQQGVVGPPDTARLLPELVRPPWLRSSAADPDELTAPVSLELT